VIKIYTISCPLTNQVRYIGKTKEKLEVRLKSHIRSTKQYNHLMSTWIKSLLSNNLLPIIEELDECESNDDANRLECMYIGLFKTWGFNLKNMTNGGDGQCNMTAEVRKKISDSRTGRFTGSDNSFFGKKHTQESIDKMKLPKSDDSIARMKKTLNRLYAENKIKTGGPNSLSRKIIKCDLNGIPIKIYDYIAQVKSDGYSRRGVTSCLMGEAKSSYGFMWKYL